MWNKIVHRTIFSLFFIWLLYTILFILCFPVMIQTKVFTEANTPFKFTIALSSKMRLDIEQWEVGLVEMFIPDYGFDIKHPCEESLKITYERVIEDKGGIGLAKFNAVDYISIKEVVTLQRNG